MSKPSIIIVIASSLDGRIAFPNGGESHLGSNSDKRILDESISLVDATLFGSGTIQAHKSTYLVKNYCENGKLKLSRKQPISIIASNSQRLNTNWQYFKQPIKRWLISTKELEPSLNGNFERCIIFKNSWLKTLSNIKKEGINKIALMGGAKLINSFIKENLIDEIQITIVPRIIGGKFTWIPSEETNEIFDLNQSWDIKSIKELNTNEIVIHYTKKIKFIKD